MEFRVFTWDTGRGWDIHGNGVTDLTSRLKVGWRSACIVLQELYWPTQSFWHTWTHTVISFTTVIAGVHLDRATSSKHWVGAAPDKGRRAYFEAFLNIILDFSREHLCLGCGETNRTTPIFWVIDKFSSGQGREISDEEFRLPVGILESGVRIGYLWGECKNVDDSR